MALVVGCEACISVKRAWLSYQNKVTSGNSATMVVARAGKRPLKLETAADIFCAWRSLSLGLRGWVSSGARSMGGMLMRRKLRAPFW